jgi:hypothetical protein
MPQHLGKWDGIASDYYSGNGRIEPERCQFLSGPGEIFETRVGDCGGGSPRFERRTQCGFGSCRRGICGGIGEKLMGETMVSGLDWYVKNPASG